MSANPNTAARADSRHHHALRLAALAGVSAAALAAAAGPAAADCTVDGDTTTCTGDVSGGVSASTSNVIVQDVTTDIAPPSGSAGVFAPGAGNVDIVLGDHTVTTVNSAGVISDVGPADGTLNFQGAVNASGQGWIHGIVMYRPQQPGSDLTLTSEGGVTVDAVQADAEPNGAGWESWGLVINGGAGTASLTSTGDIVVSSAGPAASAQTGAIGSFGGSGSTVTNSGDLTVSAASGVARGIAVNGNGVTVNHAGDIVVASGSGGATGIQANSQGALNVTSVGNITASEGGTGPFSIGHAIASSGTTINVNSTGDLTTTGDFSSGIQTAGVVVATEDSFTVDISDNTQIVSTGDITTGGNASHGIWSLGEVSNVTSEGDIATEGFGANGIVAMRNYFFNADTGELTQFDITGSSASVTSTGDISTLGNRAVGILAGAQSVSVASTGNITTAGEASGGIRALGETVVVESAGDITTGGLLAGGIVAMRNFTYPAPEGQDIFNYGASSVTVTSAGDITTTGEGAVGIGAGANLGTASVTSVGDISTASINSGGIFAQGRTALIDSTGAVSTAGNASGFLGAGAGALYANSLGGQSGTDKAQVLNVGDISTLGNDARGILAVGLADPSTGSSGDVVVQSEGDITTAGVGANGIFAFSTGGTTSLQSTGNVTTSGERGTALLANAGATASLTSVGDLTTSGAASAGAVVYAGENGTLTSTGAISTAGEGSSGLFAAGGFTGTGFASGEVLTVANTGAIDTQGYNSSGIRVFSETATVDSEGAISTQGDHSAGILAARHFGLQDNDEDGVEDPMLNSGGRVATVTSVGDITTAGNFSAGILAGANQATVTSTGDITTTGQSASAIHAQGRIASITSTGDISTSGGASFFAPGAGALYAQSFGGAPGELAAEIVSTGDIATAGEGAYGAIALASGNPENLPGSARIHSTGNVSTTGNLASGLTAFAGGDAEVVSVGDVSISGDYGTGLFAAGNQDTGKAIVSSTGNITTAGLHSRGIIGEGADVSIDVAGSVTTAGQYAYGVMAVGAFELNDDGPVLTAAAQSVSIENSGAIATTGEEASGVVVLGQDVTVQNSGTISSDYVGLLLGADVDGLENSGRASAVASIHNTGSISGTTAAVFSAQQTTFTNAGALDSGEGNLDALLSDYDDTLILMAGSSYDGYVHGAAGTDAAILRGPDLTAASGQTLGGLEAFESLTVESGFWSNAGIVGTVPTVTVASGATLQLADVQAGEDVFSPLTAPQITANGVLALNYGNGAAAAAFVGATPITGDGVLRIDGPSTLALSDTSNIQTAGGIEVAGGGFLLTGAFGGLVTTTGEGVFQLGDGTAVGDLTGDLVNNGVFIFNRPDDYVMTGAFSGSGLFRKLGEGVLTLPEAYDFEGVTRISDGAVRFAGAIDPETDFDLEDDAELDVSNQDQTVGGLSGGDQSQVNLGGSQLTVAQEEDTQFAGTISGSGGLTKTGGGTLNITGANTYTGTTSVTGGKLAVNGSIVSPVIVQSGGKVGGNGQVGNTSVSDGGAIAPGNSIGHLTVAGDLAFGPGAIYEVEVNPSGAADRVDATGVVTIDDTATVQVLAESGDYQPLTEYTILSGGGVTGQFGGVTSNMAFLYPTLNYSAQQVTLSLYRNDISFVDIAQTDNQRAVAGAATALAFGNAVYDEILVQSEPLARVAFDQLSGEIHPATMSALTQAADASRAAVLGGARAAADGPFAWAEANGSWGKTGQRDSGLASLDLEREGFIGGGGYRSGGFAFGVAGGMSQADYTLSARGSASEADTATLGATASYLSGGFTVTVGGTASWHDVDTSRQVAFGATAETLTAEYDATTTQLFGQVDYDMALTGRSWLTPFVQLAFVDTDIDQASEAGGSTALTVDGNQDVGVLTMGLAARAQMGVVQPHASLGWRQTFGDTTGRTDAQFVSGGPAFGVAGAPLPGDSAVLDAGLDVDLGAFTVGASYVGVLSSEWQDHGGRLRAAFRF